eukprot:421422-Pelagomonas_calceolata.AAC.5
MDGKRSSCFIPPSPSPSTCLLIALNPELATYTTDAASVVACARSMRSAWSATARSRASSHHAATAAAASVPAVAAVSVSACVA